jgi:hypothetical protein
VYSILLSSLHTARLSRLIGCADTEDSFSFVLFAASLSNGIWPGLDLISKRL